MFRFSLIALPLAALGTTAAADVTADDVWANGVAYMAALGGQITGTLVRDGSVVTVSDISIDFTLPLQLGHVTLTTSPQIMTEHGDGSVSVGYGDGIAYTIASRLPNLGPISATLDMRWQSFDMTCTGTPGDITYTYAIKSATTALTDYTLPKEAVGSVSLTLQNDGIDGTIRVVEGDMLRISAVTKAGPAKTDMTFVDSMGGASSYQAESRGSDSITELVLLPGGADLLNLSPALQAGMSLSLKQTAQGGSSITKTFATAGNMLTNDTQQTGASDAAVRIDQTGIDMTASVNSWITSYTLPEPASGQVDVTGRNVAAHITIPLLSGTDPQPFRYAIRLDELTLSDDTWALFDPTAQFPRDPGSVDVDITGTATFGFDVVDAYTWADLYYTNDIPVTANSVSIDALTLNGAGLAFAGTGEFTFDPTDTYTIPGMPRPQGTATMSLAGLSGFFDRLVAMGLMDANEAMMTRLGMGMVFKAEGTDSLTSSIVIDEAGQISANGQRLR